MNISLLESALEYSKKGFFVFPCREKESLPFITKSGKQKTLKPKSPYYKGGFQNATTDGSQIKAWWNKHPNAGIGISCGHSNLVVVDIDIKDGHSGFDTFMGLNVSDEGALHSITPSGGMHIIYKGLTNSYANVKTAIDLRSLGSYILVPPSFIIDKDGNKKSYIAVDDWEREPINVPSSLIEKLNLLRGKHTNENKRESIINNGSIGELKIRAKKALDKLPQEYCDERWKWINVGLSLKTLGEDAFSLWDQWSSKSSKYDKDDCRYIWDKFEPRDITLGSLFYWAYGDKNGR